MIASIVGVSLIVVAAVVGAVVFSYLFLRSNPAKKAAIDAEVDKISKKL